MATSGQQQQNQNRFVAALAGFGLLILSGWRWILGIILLLALVWAAYTWGPPLMSAYQERFGNNTDSGQPLSGVATADATADAQVAVATDSATPSVALATDSATADTQVVATDSATTSAAAAASVSVTPAPATPSVLTAADIRQIVREEVAACCSPSPTPAPTVAPTPAPKKAAAAPKKPHKKYSRVPRHVKTPCPCWADKITHPVSFKF